MSTVESIYKENIGVLFLIRLYVTYAKPKSH